MTAAILAVFAVSVAAGCTPKATDDRVTEDLHAGADLVLTLGPHVSMAFVAVPAGEFLMGSEDDDSIANRDEIPKHTVHLEEYHIGLHEVTVAQFRAFVESTGYKTTAERSGWAWVFRSDDWHHADDACWRYPSGPEGDPAQDDHPVTQVSWDDAVAFCRWASETTGHSVRLPTEAEWEKAARGVDGRLYPWGNEEPSADLLNFNQNVGSTTPAGDYPDGVSPYGALGMAGNVYEWTANLKMPFPYEYDDGREDQGFHASRVYKGGGYHSPGDRVRCALRLHMDPASCYSSVGFRVCISQRTLAGDDPAHDDRVFAAGERVQVNWQGDWYMARVLDVDGSLHYITYEGWDSSWDEWVRAYRIQDLPEGDGRFAAGDLVEVEWEEMWYTARVLEAAGDHCYVTYEGYDSSWDEWISDSQIRVPQGELAVASVHRPVVVVERGTGVGDLPLPEDVRVTLQSGHTFWAGVQWQPDCYDGSETGEQALSGQITALPSNVTNPDNVTAGVIVWVRSAGDPPSRLRVGGDTDVDGLLFYVEDDGGNHAYYFGIEPLDLTHVVLEDQRGQFVCMVIFNADGYPIQWVFPDFSAAVITPRDEGLNPRAATHVFAFDREQGYLTLDIELDATVGDLLDRMPAGVGMEMDPAIGDLIDQDMLAMTVREAAAAAETPHELVLAAHLAVAQVGTRMLEGLEAVAVGNRNGSSHTNGPAMLLAEGQKGCPVFRPVSIIHEVYDTLRSEAAGRLLDKAGVPMSGTVVTMFSYLRDVIDGRAFDGRDIDGPKVSMLICKGASAIPYVCTEFYMPNIPGNASRCLALCFATIDCFTHICHPMMFSVGDALKLRQPR